MLNRFMPIIIDILDFLSAVIQPRWIEINTSSAHYGNFSANYTASSLNAEFFCKSTFVLVESLIISFPRALSNAQTIPFLQNKVLP